MSKQLFTTSDTKILNVLTTYDELQILKSGDILKIDKISDKSDNRLWIHELSGSIERGDGKLVASMFKTLSDNSLAYRLLEAKLYVDKWINGLKK